MENSTFQQGFLQYYHGDKCQRVYVTVTGGQLTLLSEAPTPNGPPVATVGVFDLSKLSLIENGNFQRPKSFGLALAGGGMVEFACPTNSVRSSWTKAINEACVMSAKKLIPPDVNSLFRTPVPLMRAESYRPPVSVPGTTLGVGGTLSSGHSSTPSGPPAGPPAGPSMATLYVAEGHVAQPTRRTATPARKNTPAPAAEPKKWNPGYSVKTPAPSSPQRVRGGARGTPSTGTGGGARESSASLRATSAPPGAFQQQSRGRAQGQGQGQSTGQQRGQQQQQMPPQMHQQQHQQQAQYPEPYPEPYSEPYQPSYQQYSQQQPMPMQSMPMANGYHPYHPQQQQQYMAQPMSMGQQPYMPMPQQQPQQSIDNLTMRQVIDAIDMIKRVDLTGFGRDSNGRDRDRDSGRDRDRDRGRVRRNSRKERSLSPISHHDSGYEMEDRYDSSPDPPPRLAREASKALTVDVKRSPLPTTPVPARSLQRSKSTPPPTTRTATTSSRPSLSSRPKAEDLQWSKRAAQSKAQQPTQPTPVNLRHISPTHDADLEHYRVRRQDPEPQAKSRTVGPGHGAGHQGGGAGHGGAAGGGGLAGKKGQSFFDFKTARRPEEDIKQETIRESRDSSVLLQSDFVKANQDMLASYRKPNGVTSTPPAHATGAAGAAGTGAMGAGVVKKDAKASYEALKAKGMMRPPLLHTLSQPLQRTLPTQPQQPPSQQRPQQQSQQQQQQVQRAVPISTPVLVSNDSEHAEWQRFTQWLESIGMENYINDMKEQGVNKLSIIELLSEQDLQQIGVTEQDIPCILSKIADLTQRIRSFSMELPNTPSKMPPSKAIPTINLKTIKKDLLKAFDSGELEKFFSWWQSLRDFLRETSLGETAAAGVSEPLGESNGLGESDMNSLTQLVFHLHLYFVMYPMKHKLSKGKILHAKEALRVYLDKLLAASDKTDSLTTSKEFAIFAGLVFVPFPQLNPAYNNLFEDEWTEALRARLEQAIDGLVRADVTSPERLDTRLDVETEMLLLKPSPQRFVAPTVEVLSPASIASSISQLTDDTPLKQAAPLTLVHPMLLADAAQKAANKLKAMQAPPPPAPAGSPKGRVVPRTVLQQQVDTYNKLLRQKRAMTEESPPPAAPPAAAVPVAAPASPPLAIAASRFNLGISSSSKPKGLTEQVNKYKAMLQNKDKPAPVPAAPVSVPVAEPAAPAAAAASSAEHDGDAFILGAPEDHYHPEISDSNLEDFLEDGEEQAVHKQWSPRSHSASAGQLLPVPVAEMPVMQLPPAVVQEVVEEEAVSDEPAVAPEEAQEEAQPIEEEAPADELAVVVAEEEPAVAEEQAEVTTEEVPIMEEVVAEEPIAEAEAAGHANHIEDALPAAVVVVVVVVVEPEAAVMMSETDDQPPAPPVVVLAEAEAATEAEAIAGAEETVEEEGPAEGGVKKLSKKQKQKLKKKAAEAAGGH